MSDPISPVLRLVLQYVDTYYPGMYDRDFELLEVSRIETAQKWTGKREDSDGWTAIEHISEMVTRGQGSKDFIERVRSLLNTLPARGTENVRGIVKSIWMTRRDVDGTFTTKYPDWIPIHTTAPPDEIHATLQIEEGKVYAVFDDRHDKDNKASQLYSTFQKTCETPTPKDAFVLNPESGHITIVNSDKVAKINKADFETFMSNWTNKPVSAQVEGFKHTISLDWARFGPCVVATLTSPSIDAFVTAWNLFFPDVTIKPTLHTTILVVPRH